MTFYEGESTRPVLVLPAGAFGVDTAVTLTPYAPSTGAGASITCTAADGGQTHTANTAVTFTEPGLWTYRWTITGTGAATRYSEDAVAPAPTAAPMTGVRVYASTADYARWLSATPPTGAYRALVVASQRVDELLTSAVYDTDVQGYPVDTNQRQALRLATCAQADYMRAIGDPYGRGALGSISSVSIGGVSVGRAVTASGTTSPPRFSIDAVQFLNAAGLLNHGPITGW